MNTFRYGGNREISVSIGVPSGLHRGLGLHRLTIPITVDTRKSMNVGVPVDLRGEAWLSVSGHEWLGVLRTEYPVVTREGPDIATLLLSLTDEQLAVMERRRAGADLKFQLDLWATLGYDPGVAQGDADARWPSKQIQAQIDMQSGAWERLLNQVGSGVSLAIVLPTPLSNSDGVRGPIGELLREAIRKVNSGEYGDAVVAARKVLDIVERQLPSAKSALETPQQKRNLEQRLGLLREALASLAGPAPHGDPVAASITWNRELALTVIASIAAFAACLP